MPNECRKGETEEIFYSGLCKKPMSPSSEIVECSFCGKMEQGIMERLLADILIEFHSVLNSVTQIDAELRLARAGLKLH